MELKEALKAPKDLALMPIIYLTIWHNHGVDVPLLPQLQNGPGTHCYSWGALARCEPQTCAK